MTTPFDIFENEESGTVLRVGSATTLDDAKSRIRQIAADTFGEYLVLNQITGNKVVVKFDEISGA
jgi:hypothetical protein